jgi:hypothetical protein
VNRIKPLIAAMAMALPLTGFSAGFYVPPSETVGCQSAGDIEQTKQETIAQCRLNPASCGITIDTVSAYSQVSASNSYGESEPNNTSDTADQLIARVPYRGQSASSSDQDWYFIRTTTANQVLSLLFSVGMLQENDSGSWQVTITNIGEIELANTVLELDNDGPAGQLVATLAEPGYYFIRVQPAAAAAGGATTTGGSVNYLDYNLLANIDSTSQPVAEDAPNTAVFRRGRLRLPRVDVYDDSGNSGGSYQATMDQTGSNTFVLTDALPIQ